MVLGTVLRAVFFLEPADEGANIDAANGPFEVATVDDSEDHDFLAVWPEEGPKIPGLDLPELLAPEFLHFAWGPGRRLQELGILQDLEGVSSFQPLQIPLGPRSVQQDRLIHGGAGGVSSSPRG